jgi:hypothetical protein
MEKTQSAKKNKKKLQLASDWKETNFEAGYMKAMDDVQKLLDRLKKG